MFDVDVTKSICPARSLFYVQKSRSPAVPLLYEILELGEINNVYFRNVIR